ncbi:uncharacterized protein BT62DRAFT_336677 [Guyanagaster necrorhizus]|uniref:Uncharacterized protein n=1 Tax=Guyanagaster necrorhizus TaxID=856835 RepID=A0A9P8APR3_9AGAR|nr:uncharacterized protein BT62DRAFT_336677 [Guyanagaster necrorhizus MCA 3950]KAG7443225.1 hypothetical protein BT62DRAFT_336677 [Guyanagaster necrorhizus MCA 3950]
MDADTEICMCIAVAIQDGPQGKSFEEVRIDDYLKAYSTTGRPPAPCPQIPIASLERATLGLPPLFEPQRLPKQKSAASPDFQLWEQTRVAEEYFQSIVAAPRYVGYSPEELRCQAYEKGNKMLPPSMASLQAPVFSFGLGSPTQSTLPSTLPLIQNTLPPIQSTLPLLQSTILLPPMQSTLVSDTNGEVFASITAQNAYSQHSFEPQELHVAYLLAGKEMTSTEIMSASAVPVVPARPALRLF